MMRAAEGAEYTARDVADVPQRHQHAGARTSATADPAGAEPAGLPPVPVTTPEAILARFPNRVVDDDGTEMSLENWATGQPMRDKIKELVEFFTTERWKEGKLTGVVKGLSVGKDVAPGLEPDARSVLTSSAGRAGNVGSRRAGWRARRRRSAVDVDGAALGRAAGTSGTTR